MVDRSMTAAMLTELGATQNTPVHLLDLDFDTGTEYCTDAAVPIVFGGNTYTALGHLLSFSDVSETGELLINRITVAMSGVDKDRIVDFQTKEYLDREMKIHLAMLDADLQLINDPLLIFHGRMDSPKINEDPDNGSCVASVDGVPIWSESGRTPGRHTNHEEQTFFFTTTDNGFEFVSEIPKTLLWGRA